MLKFEYTSIYNLWQIEKNCYTHCRPCTLFMCVSTYGKKTFFKKGKIHTLSIHKKISKILYAINKSLKKWKIKTYICVLDVSLL